MKGYRMYICYSSDRFVLKQLYMLRLSMWWSMPRALSHSSLDNLFLPPSLLHSTLFDLAPCLTQNSRLTIRFVHPSISLHRFL